MTISAVRFLIAVVLFLHGVGHLLAILPFFGLKLSSTHSADSWLLTPMLGESISRGFGVIIWMLALMVFTGSSMSLLGWVVSPQHWRTLAITAALISLLGVTLYWYGFPFLFPNKIGVIAIDIATLICLVWLHWPQSVFEN